MFKIFYILNILARSAKMVLNGIKVSLQVKFHMPLNCLPAAHNNKEQECRLRVPENGVPKRIRGPESVEVTLTKQLLLAQ
jgi:hypothetical protein